MKRNLLILAGIIAVAVASSAQGDDSATATTTTSKSTKTSDANTSKVQLPSNATSAKLKDTDEEITNARLRASTGSKSRFSFRSEFDFNAGSLQDITTREQLTAGQIEPTPLKLAGRISGKYRITDRDSISVGTGIGWLKPGSNGQAGQVEDPYLTYDRLFAFKGIQNVSEVNLTKYTAISTAQGLQDIAESDINHTFLWAVPKTGLQLGLAIEWAREFYQNPILIPISKGGSGINGADQNFNTLAAYPFMEYEFNKTLSFRTVLRNMSFYDTLQAPGTFSQDAPSQSLGLSISVTRDIYLYPNMQFVWQHIATNLTNLSLNTYINLF